MRNIPVLLIILATAARLPVFSYTDTTNPYGVCAHLPGEGNVRTELAAIKAAGINWVRADFSWGSFEGQRGVWTYTKFDSVVRIADSMQVSLLPILCYNAAYGDTAWMHLDEWSAYVTNVVNRYKNSLKHWEVWNEENIGFWKDGTNQKALHYVQLLQASYNAIKAVDPQLKVLLGGLAGVPFDYIDSLYTNGAKAYFDIMAVHPYRWPFEPEMQVSNLTLHTQLLALQSKMAAYGDAAKPIWSTEVGWPTHVMNTTLWGGIIRNGLRSLGSTGQSWKIAFLDDPAFPPCAAFPISDIHLSHALPNPASTITRITLSQLATLQTSGYNALLMPPSESFPADYWGDIMSFVKTGGAFVLVVPGVPLYYTLRQTSPGVWTSAVASNTYRRQLHFDFEAWWTNSSAPTTTSQFNVPAPFTDSLVIPSSVSATRFLTNQTKTGDVFSPMINAVAAPYTAPVTAAIKLNSDTLTGACLVSTILLPLGGGASTEEKQAAMVPRTHLISLQTGIRRTFWYEFQAPENDSSYSEDHFGITHKNFSPKPAYTAYQTLSRTRPAGSLLDTSGAWRSTDSTVYYPHWQRPDGRKGWALWSVNLNQPAQGITITGSLDSAFDIYGNALDVTRYGNTLNLTLTGNPVYLIGPATLAFGAPVTLENSLNQAGLALLSRQRMGGVVEFTVHLKSAGTFALSVYDLAGHRLWNYPSPAALSGETRITWKANEFSSGIYFASLRQGKQKLHKKLILIR